jgi:hypothetical protein
MVHMRARLGGRSIHRLAGGAQGVVPGNPVLQRNVAEHLGLLCGTYSGPLPAHIQLNQDVSAICRTAPTGGQPGGDDAAEDHGRSRRTARGEGTMRVLHSGPNEESQETEDIELWVSELERAAQSGKQRR